MGLYTALARPLLFRLSPERAHHLGGSLLGVKPVWSTLGPFLAARDARLGAKVGGLEFPNPIGVAAGLDKDCRFLPGLLDIGFGFATGGTITRNPRPGNARPRVLRDVNRRALINALGFPGDGLDAAETRLRKLSSRHRARVLASVSGTEVDDIAECHGRLQPLVAGVEVNVSSPNTAGLRVFHEPDNLRRLVDRLATQRDRPLFVKLPPWRSDAERDGVMPMAHACVDAGADGLVIANTHPVDDSRLAVGRGGLSGAPLFDDTLRMVTEARSELGRGVVLIGCGGAGSADQAWRLMEAGANAVQLYTAFIYEGPGLPGRINRELIRLMEARGRTRLPVPA